MASRGGKRSFACTRSGDRLGGNRSSRRWRKSKKSAPPKKSVGRGPTRPSSRSAQSLNFTTYLVSVLRWSSGEHSPKQQSNQRASKRRTRMQCHRPRSSSKFISHILFGSSLLRFLCPEHRASLLAPDTFRSSRSSAPVREFHGHEAGDRDGDEELPDNGLQIR
jgi:hypothetical protein